MKEHLKAKVDIGLAPHLDEFITQTLHPGERLKWLQQPLPKARFKKFVGVWFFAIPWLCITSYASVSTYLNQNDVKIAELFAVLVGLLGMGLPIFEWFRATRTLYIVTNKRLFTIEYVSAITLTHIDISKIRNIDKTIRDDGSGDLILYKEVYLDSDNDEQTKEYGFFCIPNVYEAEKQVLRLLENRESSLSILRTAPEISVNKTRGEPVTKDNVEAKLSHLHAKAALAKESAKFVVDIKIEALIKNKQQWNMTLSQQDRQFLMTQKKRSAEPQPTWYTESNVIGTLAVIAVIFVVFLKS